MKRFKFVCFTAICTTMLFSLTVVPSSWAGDEAIVPGIQELYRIDRLAVLKDSVKVGSISSYDRSGGNDDGFSGKNSFVRKEKDGLVLADLTGPGVIYRIWTPTPSDDVMEFYFDGETAPRISVKFRELFMGKHPVFECPLVGHGAGGFYSYVPLPFEKSCKVFIRAEKMQFYQINYAIYPEGKGIKTFVVNPDAGEKKNIEKAKTLFYMAGKDIRSYVVPEGISPEIMKTKVTLEPGKKASLFELNKPGRIVGIRITPADAIAGKKRDIVLRAYWDGEKEPSIVCPAGDFFGYAWGEPSAKSLLIGSADGVDYCYFPMPFDKSARMELLNESADGKDITVEAEVLFSANPRQKNEGKFYSVWHRENPTTKGNPFTFLDTEGHGHLVGLTQQSQGMESGNTYFFEGDDQTTIDGELAIHGTGSEDFYNGGWYDVPGRWETRRAFVLSGCLGYKKHLGRSGAYRLFLGDTYAYHKSIVQAIEHAPEKNELLNDYCGVVYFYSENRPTCQFGLPPVRERSVNDPKKIIFAAGWNVPIYSFSIQNATLTKYLAGVYDKKEVRCISMRGAKDDMFGDHSIGFICDIPAAGKYKISLDAVKGPEQGKVQLFLDETPVGPAVDLYNPEKKPVQGEYIGTIDLEQGNNNLMFKIIGKNEKSSCLGFDMTNIVCERVE